MPSKEFEQVLQLLKSKPDQSHLTIEERRAAAEEALRFPLADDVRCEKVDVAGMPGEWISVPESQEGRVLLYLHGGGYVECSVNTHRELISRLARACRARALAIDYRLAPEHPFPAAVEDAVAAYRWLLSRGVRPDEIVICGDSAGGGLTVAALVALRDAGDPLPAAGVCISPWADMECTGVIKRAGEGSMLQAERFLKTARTYLAGADPRTPLASPIHADLRGLPPLLIQVGAAEELLDDSIVLAERAKAAGVDVTLEQWDGMNHVWHIFASILPEARQAIDRIGAFVEEWVG